MATLDRIRQWLQRDATAAPEGPTPLRILMVCMGNICRSPTAEGVLRAKLQTAGLQGRVIVASAGTHGYHTGEAPDPRAVRHAAQRGYDLSRQRARPFVADDFQRFDWLLAMDHDNLAWLRKHEAAGASEARVELLMPYALRHAQHAVVPDPYYGGPAGFEQVLDLVEDACDGVVRRLQGELASPSQ